MISKKFILASFLLCLLAFIIPIEHKYDKLFRYFSLTLIPSGIELSPIFDKKIYFYVSDFIALALFLIALAWFRIPLSRFFVKKSTLFLWIIFICSFASILVSPFAHYPIIYIRLLQLLTPILLFSFLAHAFEDDQRDKITRFIFCALIVAGLMQTAIAITQYFNQEWLGLRILGEQKLGPGFGISSGNRWIIDSFTGRIAPSPLVYRASGTLPHPNVLGGFLTFAILVAYSQIASSSKKWRLLIGFTLPFQFFALSVTYSRAAIFACLLGTLVWFSLIIWNKGLKEIITNSALRFLTFMICFSVMINGILLFEQFAKRGGIVNYNGVAQNSDRVRIHYQNVAFQMIGKNPLLGVGFHQFSLRYPDYLPKNNDSDIYLTATHNIYLLLGSETGLISLGAFFLFIGTLLRAGMRASITPATASLIAVFAAYLFIGCCDFYPILFQQGKLMFFCAAGLLAAHGHYEKKKLAIYTQ